MWVWVEIKDFNELWDSKFLSKSLVPLSLLNHFLFYFSLFHSRNISSFLCCSLFLLLRILPPPPTLVFVSILGSLSLLFLILLRYHLPSELSPNHAVLHFNSASAPRTPYHHSLSSLSCVRLLATPWTAAYQAPPPMGFSRQEYWSGVPLPSPTNLDSILKSKDITLLTKVHTAKAMVFPVVMYKNKS